MYKSTVVDKISAQLIQARYKYEGLTVRILLRLKNLSQQWREYNVVPITGSVLKLPVSII
jgi:hypothetical protein